MLICNYIPMMDNLQGSLHFPHLPLSPGPTSFMSSKYSVTAVLFTLCLYVYLINKDFMKPKGLIYHVLKFIRISKNFPGTPSLFIDKYYPFLFSH